MKSESISDCPWCVDFSNLETQYSAYSKLVVETDDFKGFEAGVVHGSDLETSFRELMKNPEKTTADFPGLIIIPREHLDAIDEEFKQLVIQTLEPMGYTPHHWDRKFNKGGHPVISFFKKQDEILK